MAVSSASTPVVPKGLNPDLTKAAASFYGIIPTAGTAQTINPTADVNSGDIINLSTETLTALIVFKTGITAADVAANQVLIIPPQMAVNFSFKHDSGLAADIPAVESVTVTPVTVPSTTTAGQTLTAKTTLTSTAPFVINFVQE